MKILMGNNLIKRNTEPFEVIRRSGGQIINGNYVESVEQMLVCSLMITTAKKQDLEFLNVGKNTKQVVKVRQWKNDTNLVTIDDEFTFNGYKFKITSQKLYMNHFNDFNVWYAESEADSFDK